MKLLRLHVENFGTLQNYDLEPANGLYTLHRENGWGKSTLAVFIKAMLYGLPASSKRSLDENERKKYAPWQGGAYGGSIEFETSRGRFRAERFFAPKESGDTFVLFDLATNQPSDVYSAALGEELFGIDADGFERTTYLSQREIGGGGSNTTVAARLGSLLDDVDDIGSFDTAIAALEKRRKFYTLTGNRGAVADAEQERRDLQLELERCQRVEDSMHLREQELVECTAQLQALQDSAAKTREQLKQAGLMRERNALMEQKNKMLNELSRLAQEKKAIEERFNGLLPGEAEHAEAVRLYESIKETHARLCAIPTVSPDADTVNALQSKYPNGFPTSEQAEALNKRNELLRELRTRRETLAASRPQDPTLQRFAKGAPSPQQIEDAFHQIKEAEAQQKGIDALQRTSAATVTKSSRLLPAILLAAAGVLLAMLALLSVPTGVRIALLIGGLLLAASGATLFFFYRDQQRKQNDRNAQLRADLQRRQAERERNLQSVRRLLAAYGMPAESDLGRGLTELNLLASQYRDALRQQKRISDELDAISRRYTAVLESLRAYFTDAPLSEDYRPELDRMQRDATLYARLVAEDRQRRAARASAEAEMEEMQRLLLPFLRRYDSKGTLRAGDCLTAIGEQIAEHRRLTVEIRRREKELKAFITEKDLDSLSFDAEAVDFDRLSRLETELQQQITELQQQQARLRSTIEGLSVDADKVPDLNAQMASLNERIREYKANSATIAATAKFLEEAKVALSTRYLDGMQKSFCKYLSLLMGEEAPEAVLDASFEVHLREGGQTRSMESFSRGWRDAVRFCLRLSLTAALYEETEKPFLLLDDPFVNLDERRLAAARRLLSALSHEYQIIHMVCHKDRV